MEEISPDICPIAFFAVLVLLLVFRDNIQDMRSRKRKDGFIKLYRHAINGVKVKGCYIIERHEGVPTGLKFIPVVDFIKYMFVSASGDSFFYVWNTDLYIPPSYFESGTTGIKNLLVIPNELTEVIKKRVDQVEIINSKNLELETKRGEVEKQILKDAEVVGNVARKVVVGYGKSKDSKKEEGKFEYPDGD